MSPRRGGAAPWAPTSVPEIRRHWSNAIDALVVKHSAALEPPPGDFTSAAGARYRQHRQATAAKLAEEIRHMQAEAEALRGALLFWVSREMVDVVVQAADSLPAWTPELAMPAKTGLLCWAKSPCLVPFAPQRVDVAWDGLWWWTRPDGVLQIQLASRLAKQRDLLEPLGIQSPLWAGHTLVMNPAATRTAEVVGSAEASPFVRIVGAAWLLMGQRTVSETRVLADRTSAGAAGAAGEMPPAVSIVELRRRVRQQRERTSGGGPGRTYHYRWDVAPFWRQQACGPQWSQRKPLFITGFEKGPEGAPHKDSVRSLRR
jgi:hypothetical protein